MAYEGFSKDTLKFLKGLSKNNNKSWFDAHKGDYQEHWLEAGQTFVSAAGPQLKKISKSVNFEPKMNGSIFRIYRDVRFSKDKTPYKDHLDLWFWDGPQKKGAASGFFFRLKADELMIGVGAHGFDKDRLARFRERASDTKGGKTLVAAVRKVEKAGYPVEGEHYKKLPRGLEAEGDLERLLKHNALFCGHGVKGLKNVEALATSGDVLKHCLTHWKAMAPLHKWLIDELG